MIKRLNSISRNRVAATKDLSSLQNGVLILSFIHDAISHLINPLHQIAKSLQVLDGATNALNRIADARQHEMGIVARRRETAAQRPSRLPRKHSRAPAQKKR
jgi:hypothetical protein